jgi:hypothetical protein
MPSTSPLAASSPGRRTRFVCEKCDDFRELPDIYSEAQTEFCGTEKKTSHKYDRSNRFTPYECLMSCRNSFPTPLNTPNTQTLRDHNSRVCTEKINSLAAVVGAPSSHATRTVQGSAALRHRNLRPRVTREIPARSHTTCKCSDVKPVKVFGLDDGALGVASQHL